MIFTLTILLIKDPELLEKRFKTKEKEKETKAIQKLALTNCNRFLLPGFDFSIIGSNVPLWLVFCSSYSCCWIHSVYNCDETKHYAPESLKFKKDQK